MAGSLLIAFRTQITGQPVAAAAWLASRRQQSQQSRLPLLDCTSRDRSGGAAEGEAAEEAQVIHEAAEPRVTTVTRRERDERGTLPF